MKRLSSDSTEKGNPFISNQKLFPGLETELEGKTKGDVFKVTSSPRMVICGQSNCIQELYDQFSEPAEIREGMQFQADTPEGPMILTVLGNS